jgi:hypothetical protein
MNKIEITIKFENSDFEEYPELMTATILRSLADKLENLGANDATFTGGYNLRDNQGNIVGLARVS